MAMQTPSPPAAPSAQVVGNAFVEQYYHILHHSPELVYRFYQDSSVLSRPDSNGVMTSAATMKGINDRICSLDFKNYKAEIKTADAQESYNGGVIVLVTGCLTGRDNLRRKFTQTFFLAPQDKGYFVLNDVFRYVEEGEILDGTTVTGHGTDETQSPSLKPDPEPAHVLNPPMLDATTIPIEEVQNVDVKAHDPSDDEKQLASEEEMVVPAESHSNENQVSAVTESASSTAQEETPKKSYASIVSSQTKKGSSGPIKVYVPSNSSRTTPTKNSKPSFGSPAHASGPEELALSVPGSTNAPENRNAQEEAEGYSIYIRNLPLNVTDTQLESEFKKFGPIKPGGVQVRSHKQEGFCFGFVEFQDLSSMQSAIQASPILIGGRQAAVEIKRTTTRVGSGRGRFPSGRGAGFRNDSFRGRGTFGGGRSYGRNEFANRGDFSGRGRGPGGRTGEGYQQGRGRGGRRGGPYQNAV